MVEKVLEVENMANIDNKEYFCCYTPKLEVETSRTAKLMNTLRLNRQDGLGIITALSILIGFICLSIPRLHLPHFWDASWVYGPAIYDMSRGIPSLLPDSLDVNIARGHPLMFHFLGAIWVKIFGYSPISLNVFTLCISLATLFMVYRLGLRFFGKTAGIIAMAICAAQEMFVAQALQTLPEMLLALFVLTTWYTYLRERYLLFVISGVALLLTKETGIVAIGAISILHLIKVIFATEAKGRLKEFGKGVLFIGLPVLIASSHYIYQKVVYGWFFFPEHVQSQIWDPIPILHRLRDVFDLIFMWQGRSVITLVTLAVLCIWIGRKKIWPGVVLFMLLVAMHQIFYAGYNLSVPLRFVLPVLCFMAVFIWFVIPYAKKNPASGLATNGLVIYLALFMGFTAINLLTSRYVLNGVVIYSLICGLILSRFVFKKWMVWMFIAFPIAIFIYQLTQPKYVKDINMTYADGVKMYQSLTTYFSNDTIRPCTVMGTLLEAVAMGDPRAGYVAKAVDSVTVVIQRDTMKLIEGRVDYLINSNVLEYVNLPKSDPGCCELIDEIRIGEAHAEIYKISK